MTPTRPRTLVLLGLGVALAVLGLLSLARLVLPAVPWTVPVAVVLVALGVLAAALGFRRRLLGAPGARPYDPLQAARMVVLAKASSHAGAVLAGGYLGFTVALLLRSTSRARLVDAALAGASVLAALALVGLGLWLERMCRVPSDDERPPGATTA